jgi:signal transduction histidine kinase
VLALSPRGARTPHTDRVRSRRVGLLPGSLFGLTALVEAAAVALSWGLEPLYDTVVYAVVAVVGAGAGALVAARHPGNPIGWLLLGFALLNALISDVAQGWGLRAAAEGWPSGTAGEWITASSWLPSGFGWILTLLLFPDGRLPGRRWRWVLWTAAIGLGLALPGWALGPERGLDLSSGRNPVAVDWLPTDAMVAVGMTLFLAALLAAVVSLVQRFRGSTGDLRQQLKLIAVVAVVLAVLLPASFALWYVTPLAGVLAAVPLTLLPVAICVAILRYRLYDIDVLIDRTVVYATVTALLAVAYGATALVLGTTLGGGSGWATAGATLVVAVAFRPLRDRVQDVVDRQFHRARYHAVHRMADFLDALRAGRTAPEDVEAVLGDLLGDPGLRLLVFLPESEVYVGVDGVLGPAPSSWPPSRTAIDRDGRPLGVVLHERADHADPALVREVVEAAGLAVEITRLRAELRRRLAEVRASRARIVLAADEERRRIERDLHDGAQQRLVSIGLALRHAQHELGTAAPQEAGATIDAAVAEVTVAIQELRELARGLPPAQLDAGLAPAFRDLARRAPVPVEVSIAAERFDRRLEGAAWFIGCEGLTNAVKHAKATTIALSAARSGSRLVLTVADDGIGGAAPVAGSGLSGLVDRVAALGGVLRIDSRPGAGTTLTAELPCGS